MRSAHGGFARRLGTSLIVAAAAAAATLAALASPAVASTGVVSNLSQGHAYRHGVVPVLKKLGGVSGPLPGALNNLSYGGGTSGVGVTTGAPKVYLVFWGSQWGTQKTNSAGNVTLSGDPRGMARRMSRRS